MICRFSVPFVRGKARVRFFRAGKHVGTYNEDETAAAMHEVRRAFLDAGGERAPKGEEVAVFIDTLRKLPKSRKKSIACEPDTFKPDIDNIAKLVLDALNGVAWADDSQVTGLYVRKGNRYRDISDETYVSVMWGEEDGWDPEDAA